MFSVLYSPPIRLPHDIGMPPSLYGVAHSVLPSAQVGVIGFNGSPVIVAAPMATLIAAKGVIPSAIIAAAVASSGAVAAIVDWIHG